MKSNDKIIVSYSTLKRLFLSIDQLTLLARRFGIMPNVVFSDLFNEQAVQKYDPDEAFNLKRQASRLHKLIGLNMSSEFKFKSNKSLFIPGRGLTFVVTLSRSYDNFNWLINNLVKIDNEYYLVSAVDYAKDNPEIGIFVKDI